MKANANVNAAIRSISGLISANAYVNAASGSISGLISANANANAIELTKNYYDPSQLGSTSEVSMLAST